VASGSLAWALTTVRVEKTRSERTESHVVKLMSLCQIDAGLVVFVVVGKWGFDEFSHHRGVFYKDTTFSTDALIPGPPYAGA
jgi:hypothetical protein